MKKCTSFEEQKVTRYIRGNVYFGIVFSSLSSTKAFPRFILICFAREIKGFYQSPLGNEVDFRDIRDIRLDFRDISQVLKFPQIFCLKINFNKLRHGFVYERALITTALISSSHWKTLKTFCLQKKRPENALLTLIVNYRKILQKNKLCHPKQ